MDATDAGAQLQPAVHMWLPTTWILAHNTLKCQALPPSRWAPPEMLMALPEAGSAESNFSGLIRTSCTGRGGRWRGQA